MNGLTRALVRADPEVSTNRNKRAMGRATDTAIAVSVFTVVLLALGLMEAGRVRWAIAAALVTALCREETPLYALPIGLYWVFRRNDWL